MQVTSVKNYYNYPLKEGKTGSKKGGRGEEIFERMCGKKKDTVVYNAYCAFA